MCLLTSPAQHDPRPEVVLNQHHLLSLDLLPEARLDFEQILRNSCLLLTSCWGLVAPRSSSCSGVCFCQGAGTNTWGIAKARRFQAVKDLAGFISDAKSNGVAHSPSGFELWLEADERQPSQRKGWREWDIQQSKWVQRPEAGVVSRGKVRPKAGVTLPKAEVPWDQSGCIDKVRLK
eukprot:s33_g43.t1